MALSTINRYQGWCSDSMRTSRNMDSKRHWMTRNLWLWLRFYFHIRKTYSLWNTCQLYSFCEHVARNRRKICSSFTACRFSNPLHGETLFIQDMYDYEIDYIKSTSRMIVDFSSYSLYCSWLWTFDRSYSSRIVMRFSWYMFLLCMYNYETSFRKKDANITQNSSTQARNWTLSFNVLRQVDYKIFQFILNPSNKMLWTVFLPLMLAAPSWNLDNNSLYQLLTFLISACLIGDHFPC